MRTATTSASTRATKATTKPCMSSAWRAAGRAATCVAMGLLTLLASSAWAHKASDAYLSLQVDSSRIEQRFDIAVRDIDRELVLDANDDGVLTWGEVRTRWTDIAALAADGVQVSAEERGCRVEHTAPPALDEHSDGRYVVIAQTLQCDAPVQALGVSYRLFARSDPTHRGVTRVLSAGVTQAAVLIPGEPAHRFSLQGGGAASTSSTEGVTGFAGFAGFVSEGVHHILVGIDHIFFLLALLLPAVLVRAPQGWVAAPAIRPVLMEVLRVVTAFTVAHSITLALAVFGVLDPPSRWVESLIAASIVFAALNNIRPVVGRRRWLITFAFGLVHGFGFAGALKDVGLVGSALIGPLIGFNLGVEIGQLGIVALFVPLAWVWRPTPAYRRVAMLGGSGAMAVLAMVWLIERSLNVQVIGLV